MSEEKIVNVMSEKEFFERFQYDSEKDVLGNGGFGTVYKARDTKKNRDVAIKISMYQESFRRFTLWNEIKLSEQIDDHANIARYEFGLRFTRPVIIDYGVMAYYEHGNLDQVLKNRNNTLTPKENYEIVEGILEGIKHLHNENVIHRDLKLGNILMLYTKQKQWRPKIADFGLSRLLEEEYDASIVNSSIGMTVTYAAPEQIEGKPIKKNVDLWALGVIVYRLLTGEMPFASVQGANSQTATSEISQKISRLQLPKKLDTVPEPYQTIIRRCWIKDTSERAQSADELLDILKKNLPNPTIITDVNPVVPPQPKSEPKPKVQEEETMVLNSEATKLDKLEAPSVSKPIFAVSEQTEIMPEVEDNADKTQIFQEEESAQPSPRKTPIWVWGILAALLLIGIAWGTGIFTPKQGGTTADKCDIMAYPDLDCDGDGILNKDDKCPKDAKNDCMPSSVPNPSNPPSLNPNGDEDGDGIKNSEDRCPYISGSKSSHGCL